MSKKSVAENIRGRELSVESSLPRTPPVNVVTGGAAARKTFVPAGMNAVFCGKLTGSSDRLGPENPNTVLDKNLAIQKG